MGERGYNFLEKGRLLTLSSAVESRKFKSRRYATETSTLGVLYAIHLNVLWVVVPIYHDVGYLELLILDKAMREPYGGIGRK